MRAANQYHRARERFRWGAQDVRDPDPPLLEAAGETEAFYRQEAHRLLGLAASSPLDDVRRQFLDLAQQYEALAEHAARRSRRGV